VGEAGKMTGGIKRLNALLADPRNYQISVLSSLILLGLFHYGFHLPWWHVVGCVGATLTTQAIADRLVKRPFDPRSPLISALSLTLLLRTGSVSLSIAAGIIAVASKYLIRWRGKHIFNPANFGLIIVSLLFGAAWISPGQWGQATLFALLLLALGGIVTGKAKRWDVSLSLLVFYAGLVFVRPNAIGRFAGLCIFYDFRPQDDTKFQNWARFICRTRSERRLHHSIRIL